MAGLSLLKPQYLFRPSQAARRLLHAWRSSPPASVVVTLPWGLPIRIDAREDIGRSIWQLGLHDLVVSEALWRLVTPDSLAVDVGANIGSLTGLMALRAGPRGEVLAFEPHPQVFAELESNIGLLAGEARLAPVRLSAAAVSAAAGTAYLHSGDHFAANRGISYLTDEPDRAIPVITVTLDEVLDGRTATVVKIDVEGREMLVLQGAEESLRGGRIRHLVYEAYGDESREARDFLEKRGYGVYALGRTLAGLRLSAVDGESWVASYESPNFLATRDPATVGLLGRRGWRTLSRSIR
jgi:FkbM family methyltransferase